jgi:catechol 2,3-dioxygenase
MLNQAAAMFHPERFAHANLFVADVDVSVDFYRDICGITEVFREPGIKAGFLSNGATHHDIGLMQCSDAPLIGKDGTVQNTMTRGRVPGLNHIAFRVSTEAALIDAYRNAGQFGIKLEKALDHGMARSLYLYDPDQNAVEFYVDTVADWRGFYADNQNQLISAHWDPAETPPVPEFAAPARVDTRVPDAPLHAMEICGAPLIASDLAASRRFYEKAAGLHPVAASDKGVAILALPGSEEPCLALVAAEKGDTVGLHSLWFMVDADSPVLQRDPSDSRFRVVPTDGGKRCFVRDPNGIFLGFYPGSATLPRVPTRAEVLASSQAAS